MKTTLIAIAHSVVVDTGDSRAIKLLVDVVHVRGVVLGYIWRGL